MWAKRRIITGLSVALAVGFLVIRWVSSRADPPHNPGVSNGQLAPCPDRPNCVATQSGEGDQRMDPIPLQQPAEDALQQLAAVVQSMPRSRIVTRESRYLHVEFRSLFMGYVDDVEFAIDEAEQVIHFRSASRVGYSDLGVNRRRTEEIVRRYQGR